MLKDTSPLPDDPQELKRLLRRAEKENNLLREQVRLLYAKLFGKKSEKGGPDPTGAQLLLFDMPEPEAEAEKERNSTTPSRSSADGGAQSTK